MEDGHALLMAGVEATAVGNAERGRVPFGHSHGDGTPNRELWNSPGGISELQPTCRPAWQREEGHEQQMKVISPTPFS